MYVVGNGSHRHMPSCGVTRKSIVTISVPAMQALRSLLCMSCPTIPLSFSCSKEEMNNIILDNITSRTRMEALYQHSSEGFSSTQYTHNLAILVSVSLTRRFSGC